MFLDLHHLYFVIQPNVLQSWQAAVFDHPLQKSSQKYISYGQQRTKITAQETADLVTFTEEILNEKLHVLCSEYIKNTFDHLRRNFFAKIGAESS